MKQIPNISKRAFWDIDFKSLNFEKHRDYIILKVFDHGKWNDIVSIINFYGKNQVKKSLIDSEHLTEKALQLAIIIFKQPKSKFKCYTQKQYRHYFTKR